MATAFYVYDSLDEYNRLNKDYIDDLLFSVKLEDIYIMGDKMILVTNTNDAKERINTARTIIHARNGVVPDELKQKSKLVKHDTVYYDVKKKRVIFSPKFLRKPLYEVRADRYYGDLIRGRLKINYEHRFYDFVRDRVVFILAYSNPLTT